jgi:hypothetical protein
MTREPISGCLRAHFLPVETTGKKPGFPLQVLGSANALPVGFPLQSHCASADQNQPPRCKRRGRAVSDRYGLYRGFNTSVIQQCGRIKNRPKGRDWSQFCFGKIAARPCSRGIKPACRNKAPELPKAIPGAGNCLWQLPAHNKSAAICSANCVVCHHAQRGTRCARLYHHRLPARTSAREPNPGFLYCQDTSTIKVIAEGPSDWLYSLGGK